MKLVVYKNQYGFTTLAKNGDDKMYISVQFKKGTEPDGGKVDINVLDGFFSVYKDKNNALKPKFVVMSYTTTEEPAGDMINELDATDYTGDDLPF
jgi:hypothetical protein